MRNPLTYAEIHAAITGLVGFFIGATQAWSQVRREPWYFLGSFFVSLVAGILFRRRVTDGRR